MRVQNIFTKNIKYTKLTLVLTKKNYKGKNHANIKHTLHITDTPPNHFKKLPIDNKKKRQCLFIAMSLHTPQ